MSGDAGSIDAFIFAQRGALLAIPAAVLVASGKPSALSIALGLPLAFAGEAIRAWAVGYSGVTTRSNAVEAPALVTAGPYAYVRNPLYIGNAVTGLGFALAFTGKLAPAARLGLVGGALGVMLGVYAIIVPHEEAYLRETFGDAFDAYAARVPRAIPTLDPVSHPEGTYDPGVIAKAETRTFVTFGAMVVALALRALRA
jgi:protein-S-isoprenylcysteine O-methyltransferase Ste14